MPQYNSFYDMQSDTEQLNSRWHSVGRSMNNEKAMNIFSDSDLSATSHAQITQHSVNADQYEDDMPTQLESQQNHSHDPEEWISSWLKAPTLWSSILLTIAIIGTLVALTVLSQQNHGIATASIRLEVLTSLGPNLDFGIGFLWTTLPVLLFQMYSLVIGATIKAASARQPYIELRGPRKTRERGAPAEKSILLDYSSYWSFAAPFKALWYNHYMLAYSFTVLVVLTIVLSPMAAHLFYATTIPFPRQIQVQQSSEFSRNGFGHDSLQLSMDVASSTLVYGAKPIAWTTLTEAFLPIEMPRAEHIGFNARNLTVSTSAIKATLDCEVLDSSEFEMLQLQTGDWYYSWTDRGCSATHQAYTVSLSSGSSPYFIQAYAKQDCSAESGSIRILVIAAQDLNGTGDFTSKTAVSCIPSYSQIDGKLSLSIGTGSSTIKDPEIVSFDPHHHSALSGGPGGEDSIYNFNLELIQGRFFDPSNAITANEYGELVYTYVKKLNVPNFFAGEHLKAAAESTYATVFAVMANQYLIAPTTAKSQPATLYTDETRIIVVLPVACTIMGILLATAGMLVWIWIYTIGHDSILYENPTALLGAAVVLRNSRLMKMIEDIDGYAWNGKMGMAFLRQEEQKTPAQGWRFEDWGHPHVAAIESTVYARPFGLNWVRSMRRLKFWR